MVHNSLCEAKPFPQNLQTHREIQKVPPFEFLAERLGNPDWLPAYWPDASDRLKIELAHVALGYTLIPTHPIVWTCARLEDDGEYSYGGFCGCWDGDKCKAVGKHPSRRWSQEGETIRTGLRLIQHRQHEDNMGGMAINCHQSGLVVIDVDLRHGGDVKLKRLIADLGPLPDTAVDNRLSYSPHYYFQEPEGEFPTSAIKLSGDKAVELLNGSHIIIPPPYPHHSGEHRFYVVAPWEIEPQPLPDAWLQYAKELCADKEEPAKRPSVVSGWQETPEPPRPIITLPADLDRAKLAKRARAYLAKMPEAVEGHDGSGATFKVACILVEFGLSYTEAWPLLQEYSARCKPPWSDKELQHKLTHAFRHATPGKMLASDYGSDGAALTALPESDTYHVPLNVAQRASDVEEARAFAAELVASRRDHKERCRMPRGVCLRRNDNHAHHRAAWVRCNRWSCTGCAARMKRLRKENLSGYFSQAAAKGKSIYEWHGPESDWPTLSRKIRRLDGSYVKTRHEGNRLVVFTTAPLPDTKEWLSTQVKESTQRMHDAIDDADTTRSRPISPSHDWKMPERKKNTLWHRVDKVRVSPTQAKHIVKEEFGLPWYGAKLSGNVVHAFDWFIPCDWGQERIAALLAALSELPVIGDGNTENSDMIQTLQALADAMEAREQDLSG